MSSAILESIRQRGGEDAFLAYKKERPERAAHRYSISDVTVESSFVGYIYSATLRVTTNMILIKNTTVHKIELIYGQDGQFRQLKSLTDVSEFGLSF